MSWFRKQVASIAVILRGVSPEHRDAAADAVTARMSMAHPGQRVAINDAVVRALASVTPVTVSHAALEAVIDGTSPRHDLALLRKDALAKRDASGLLAIDAALRLIASRDRTRREYVGRRALKDAVARRAELVARQRVADRHRLMLRMA